MEFNFHEEQEFTRKELQQFHHLCRLRNLDMAPSNYNIWQSNSFIFHCLGKVSECVLILSIQIQALDLNDVQGALKLISNYYHEWQEVRKFMLRHWRMIQSRFIQDGLSWI